MEFEFERRQVTKEDIRELIFREILEYHPQLLKDYMNGVEKTNFLYPSAVDQFRKQFALLEENGGKCGPAIPLERKQASLPRNHHHQPPRKHTRKQLIKERKGTNENRTNEESFLKRGARRFTVEMQRQRVEQTLIGVTRTERGRRDLKEVKASTTTKGISKQVQIGQVNLSHQIHQMEGQDSCNVLSVTPNHSPVKSSQQVKERSTNNRDRDIWQKYQVNNATKTHEQCQSLSKVLPREMIQCIQAHHYSAIMTYQMSRVNHGLDISSWGHLTIPENTESNVPYYSLEKGNP